MASLEERYGTGSPFKLPSSPMDTQRPGTIIAQAFNQLPLMYFMAQQQKGEQAYRDTALAQELSIAEMRNETAREKMVQDLFISSAGIESNNAKMIQDLNIANKKHELAQSKLNFEEDNARRKESFEVIQLLEGDIPPDQLIQFLLKDRDAMSTDEGVASVNSSINIFKAAQPGYEAVQELKDIEAEGINAGNVDRVTELSRLTPDTYKFYSDNLKTPVKNYRAQTAESGIMMSTMLPLITSKSKRATVEAWLSDPNASTSFKIANINAIMRTEAADAALDVTQAKVFRQKAKDAIGIYEQRIEDIFSDLMHADYVNKYGAADAQAAKNRDAGIYKSQIYELQKQLTGFPDAPPPAATQEQQANNLIERLYLDTAGAVPKGSADYEASLLKWTDNNRDIIIGELQKKFAGRLKPLGVDTVSTPAVADTVPTPAAVDTARVDTIPTPAVSDTILTLDKNAPAMYMNRLTGELWDDADTFVGQATEEEARQLESKYGETDTAVVDTVAGPPQPAPAPTTELPQPTPVGEGYRGRRRLEEDTTEADMKNEIYSLMKRGVNVHDAKKVAYEPLVKKHFGRDTGLYPWVSDILPAGVPGAGLAKGSSKAIEGVAGKIVNEIVDNIKTGTIKTKGGYTFKAGMSLKESVDLSNLTEARVKGWVKKSYNGAASPDVSGMIAREFKGAASPGMKKPSVRAKMLEWDEYNDVDKRLMDVINYEVYTQLQRIHNKDFARR
jgi:hypothetical protein